MSKVRGVYRWEPSSGASRVGHRDGEKGFLGQEVGGGAKEAPNYSGFE